MSCKLTLRRKDSKTLLLSGMDEFLGGLMRDIPLLGTPSSQSEQRLFPDLTGGREAEADADWREFVRPDLEDHFAMNRDVVEEDLQGMRDSKSGGLEVEIPMAHLPQWIHALNQARLALNTQHNLGERELEEDEAVSGEEGLVLFHIQFYGLLQEWMLSLVDSL
jgi:hypothetical protein